MGFVEMDETYIGGKDKNRHWDKRKVRVAEGKAIVGRGQRGGNVVARVIDRADGSTLDRLHSRGVSLRR